MFKWWFASWQYMRVHKDLCLRCGPSWLSANCLWSWHEVSSLFMYHSLATCYSQMVNSKYLSETISAQSQHCKENSTGSLYSSNNCWIKVSVVATTVLDRETESQQLSQVLPKLRHHVKTESHWCTLKSARESGIAIFDSPDCEHEHNPREITYGNIPLHICLRQMN